VIGVLWDEYWLIVLDLCGFGWSEVLGYGYDGEIFVVD